jgi:PAS domain S-box-containing protein
MEPLHRLLKRQLRRHFGDPASIPADLQPFIDKVNEAYFGFDADREILEHSLELSSHELLEANSEMRAVFQAIPDLVFRIDPHGTVLDVKAGVNGELMIARQDLLGKRIQDTPLKDAASQFAEAIARVVAENAAASIEYAAVLHGQESHYEARLVPLPDREIVVIVRNITERKQSLRLLGAAVDQSTESIMITDTDLSPDGPRIVFVNAAFTRVTGYAAAEVLGQSPRLLHGPKTDRAALARLQETLARGETFAGEIINYRKDGTELDLEWEVVPLRNSSGTITHFLATKRDISARKRAENELRASHEKFRLLADNLTDVFWIRSPDMRELHYVSPAYEHIWGRSVETLYAHPHEWTDTILPEDRAAVLESFAALTGRVPQTNLEFRIARPDGEVRWVHVRGFQVRDAAGELASLTGIATDITARKQWQAELEKLHQELLETSRQAGMAEVAASVLHNIGNVLNSVNISAALVSAKVKNSAVVHFGELLALFDAHAADLGAYLTSDPEGKFLPEDLRQLEACLLAERSGAMTELELLRQNIEHIKNIVAMHQNYAKVSGVTETVQLADLVQDTLRMSAESFANHDLRVVRDFAEVPPVTVEKHKVLQILVNLVRNAKHAYDDVERPDKTLTVRIFNGEGTVKVAVADQGVGIPPENLTRIFNHGFTTRKNGHGFGLHNGALAARELGGALRVASAGPGQGATFTLELPLAKPAENHV